MSAEKTAVRKAFGAAAGTYDSVASIQRSIAERMLTQTPLKAGDKVLDAGCGTGHGARLLRQKEASIDLLALDAAHPMCTRSGEPLAVCADIEHLPLAGNCLDLYWSSLAWQWTRPALSAREAFRVLKPGAEMRVATLGPNTLCELRQAFAQVDAHPHVREFDSLDRIRSALHDAGFGQMHIEQYRLQSHAADLRSILEGLRTLGASVIGERRRRGLLGRQAWETLQSAYEHHRCPQGLPASYDVFQISARKP